MLLGEIFLITALLSPMLILCLGIMGALSQSKYFYTESEIISSPMDEVWERVSNFSEYPKWVSYVSEMTEDSNEESVWLQEGSIVPMRFHVKESSAPDLLYWEITPGNIPGRHIGLEGHRKIHLETTELGKTKVTLEEYLCVTDPLLRSYLFYYLYFFEKKRNFGRIFLDSLRERSN